MCGSLTAEVAAERVAADPQVVSARDSPQTHRTPGHRIHDNRSARFGIDPFDGRPSDYSLSPEAYGAFLKTTFDAYYAAFCRGRPVSVRNFDNYLGILMGLPPENCGQCGRCGQYFLIEADGGVYPCDFYVLDNWRIGNINDSSFFSLAKSPVGEEFRALSLLRRAECESCEWYGLCRGGCRRDREPFENGLPGLNRWCESYKALFEYAFPRMREMAEAIRRKNAR